MRRNLRLRAEREALRWALLFYRIPQVVLAPNADLLTLLGRETGKPTFLMSRGVDTEMFTPEKRCRSDSAVNLGYVGRLSAEKNVRVLAAVEEALASDGVTDVRFTIVGDGKEREWLSRRMPSAAFTGVLRGEALAAAYANMDVFVFPSETDTVGNVVLEAMASGVPVVAMARGGPKFIARPGCTILAANPQAFFEAVRDLVRDPARREAMRATARARALELSWDGIFEDVCQAYGVAISIATSGTRSHRALAEAAAD
jgi:glycosyltransferase involved in cell wall biosynthesis